MSEKRQKIEPKTETQKIVKAKAEGLVLEDLTVYKYHIGDVEFTLSLENFHKLKKWLTKFPYGDKIIRLSDTGIGQHIEIRDDKSNSILDISNYDWW